MHRNEDDDDMYSEYSDGARIYNPGGPKYILRITLKITDVQNL